MVLCILTQTIYYYRGYSGAHMRSARPTGRESIVEWFNEVEKLKGSGLDPQTEQVAPWFHGKYKP